MMMADCGHLVWWSNISSYLLLTTNAGKAFYPKAFLDNDLLPGFQMQRDRAMRTSRSSVFSTAFRVSGYNPEISLAVRP